MKLNYLDSCPLIFDSLRCLLGSWSSAYAPNGHSIVPSIIPPWTNLYHVRLDDDLPASPEWLAFDSEMAYDIWGGYRNSHMMTYQTVQPVMVLSFDGMSAAMYGGTGQLDSQSVFVDNKTSRPPAYESPEQRRKRWKDAEIRRAKSLCDWVSSNGVGGPGWGVEGIVRMNAGFELIWCAFSSPSLRLVSRLNITVPLITDKHVRNGQDDLPYIPPLMASRYREPFLNQMRWDHFRAAFWHRRKAAADVSVGEYRLRPMSCAMKTFYDEDFTAISKSRTLSDRKRLNLTRIGEWSGVGVEDDRSQAIQLLARRRWMHTLEGASISDAQRMRNGVRDATVSLINKHHNLSWMQPVCSGPDWTAIKTEIVLRYGQPLRQWLNALHSISASSTSNASIHIGSVATLRDYARLFLQHFLEYPMTAFCEGSCMSSEEKDIWKLESALGQETLQRCREHYVPAPDDSFSQRLTSSDKVLVKAVRGTMNGICSTLIRVGFGIEKMWFNHFGADSDFQLPCKTCGDVIVEWGESIEELIAWLGWTGDDTECEPACLQNELCYVPIWPLTDLREWKMSNEQGVVEFSGKQRGQIPIATTKDDENRGQETDWLWFLNRPICLKSFYDREQERYRFHET